MNTKSKLLWMMSLANVCAISILAAPFEEGREFCVNPPLIERDTLIKEGDIVFFTGQQSVFDAGTGETYECNMYVTRVVVVDPTHVRQPVVTTVITNSPVPAGTRASLGSLGCLAFCATPQGYGEPVLLIAR